MKAESRGGEMVSSDFKERLAHLSHSAQPLPITDTSSITAITHEDPLLHSALVLAHSFNLVSAAGFTVITTILPDDINTTITHMSRS